MFLTILLDKDRAPIFEFKLFNHGTMLHVWLLDLFVLHFIL